MLDNGLAAIKAIHKFAAISPTKARLVARDLRGMDAQKAMIHLSFMPKKAARLIYKVLASAIANAEENESLQVSRLQVHSVQIDEGPHISRYRARARGRASGIKKRRSHITVRVCSKQS